MSDTQWDKRLFDFLKRTSEEIKAETQRIVSEIQDPEKHRQVKESLREFGNWAKQTAEEAADMVEAAIKKAETAFAQPVGTAPGSNGKKDEKSQASPPSRPSGGSASPRTSTKKKSGGSKKSRSGAPSKTIGRRS
jgi:hypothetical protein